MKQAALIIYVVDLKTNSLEEIQEEVRQLEQQGVPFIMVGNKMDQVSDDLLGTLKTTEMVPLSAKNKTNLEELKQRIFESSFFRGGSLSLPYLIIEREVTVESSIHERPGISA